VITFLVVVGVSMGYFGDFVAIAIPLGLIAVSLGLYFLPLAVATTRDHRQVLAIGVLNLLAG
jgi:F0F1-type ATP synthase assembly protein I